MNAILMFLFYFCSSVVLFVLFSFLYTKTTPFNEIQLIRQGNKSAAVSFGGALIGFALPLVRAIEQSSAFQDLATWAGVGLIVQLLVYLIMAKVFPNLAKGIKKDQMGEALLMAAIAIAIGLLNAASMTE